MTQKRLKQLLKSTLHSLVFFSLCLAPLLSNVSQHLDTEKTGINQEHTESTENTNNTDTSNTIGLNNPLKSFWSFTRLSQRYFTQRKYTPKYTPKKFSETQNFQNKLFLQSFQATLLTNQHLVLEEPTPHLADAKRYLSHAKLQLEGG